jgi:hypothetical protein
MSPGWGRVLGLPAPSADRSDDGPVGQDEHLRPGAPAHSSRLSLFPGLYNSIGNLINKKSFEFRGFHDAFILADIVKTKKLIINHSGTGVSMNGV